MLKELIKQSFLASLAASLSGLIVFYVLGFWFISDNRLNILEFLGVTMFVMPFFISIFLVVFAIRFLSDFYKEYPNTSWWKTSSLLFALTFICVIVLDQGAFLITDDIPKKVSKVFHVLNEQDESDSKSVTAESLKEIDDIAKDAPWQLNWVTLFIFLSVASLLSHNRLKRISKPKETNYR